MITPQTQIRVRRDLKDEFRRTCQRAGKTMTAVLIDSMKQYINERMTEQGVIRQPDLEEPTQQTALALAHSETSVRQRQQQQPKKSTGKKDSQ